MSTVAQVSGLTHRYGDTVAVDDVSLEIPAGNMVGIIGPDGVGKSSLLALISGVRKIQSGDVEVLNGDMRRKQHRNSICPRIAYMPQGLGRNLYMTLSVFENVDFFGRLFGQSRDERSWRIDELLKSTGLAPFADRPAGKLSGGMKQKLGLCCALIHDPDLLILDEPTTGVDPLSRRQFWELITRIRNRRQGMSVIVSTAYMDEAERFDWLVAMDAGRILATGSPAELKSQTGQSTLEKTFIALLPEEKRRGHKAITIPPRQAHGGEAAIKASGLTRRFNGFTAVNNVSFHIESGEIFGFLGSNGCGKTTTMKMLTGLLASSEGKAWLFGRSIDSKDIGIRKRVGYMSQSFSLYTELTVRQNLELHARVFHIPKDKVPVRVAEMIQRFGLEEVQDALADKLPLGVRQRLSLAVAVIHAPEMLILDEPTSGVDPVARDKFWELLIQLSREDGVTIFISTHFMNEAERCDRISLMHAGKVLAQDTPAALVRARGVNTLEDAFIAYLEEAAGETQQSPDVESAIKSAPVSQSNRRLSFDIRRVWAYARREAMEIRHDPIRMAVALIGPILLMIVFGYGINFDIEDLAYAVLDHDQTQESRNYLDNFSGSRYFVQRKPIRDYADMETRLRRGEITLAIEIPPEFGKDLKRGRQTQVGVWLDGSLPFRAETAKSYVLGVHQFYLDDLVRSQLGENIPTLPVSIQTRFRYNQDFQSVFAMVPGSIMLLLIWVPAMMTAVGVVREKEMGSITNFYATPVSGLEFLLGKQFPYIGLALINFICLVSLALFLFHVPIKGSFSVLVLGALLYVIATTGFGLLVSSFVKTQIAAVFAAAIISVVPAINFSGYLSPAASLEGGARIMSKIFPSTHFQQISLGTFTKALEIGDLVNSLLSIAAIITVYLLLALILLKTQER